MGAYVKVFYDWIEQTEMLSDAERGRLINAIVIYARAGEVTELSGNERFVFGTFRSAIDRDALLSAKRAKIGSEGGKKSKSKQNQAKASKSKQNQANVSNKDKDEDKDYNEDNNPPVSPFGGPDTMFGDDLTAAVNDWLSYKRERRESYKPTGHKLLLSQIANKAKEYGETAVAEVIRTSISSGYKGIVFDRLRNMPIKAADDGFDPDDPYAAWGDST